MVYLYDAAFFPNQLIIAVFLGIALIVGLQVRDYLGFAFDTDNSSYRLDQGYCRYLLKRYMVCNPNHFS